MTTDRPALVASGGPPGIATHSAFSVLFPLSTRREKEEDLELRYGLLNEELRSLLAIEGNDDGIQSVTRSSLASE